MSIIGDNTNTTAENDIPNPSDSNVSEARGKKRSWVWDHFVKQNDQNASCNYCDAVLTCRTKNGTNALGNHLGRCKKYPYNVEKKQKTLKVSKEGGDGKIVPMHMFDQERCRKSLARMIVVDELPFKFVEREGFRLFCQDMQPRFLIPSRSSVARDCYSLYLDEKKKLKNFFSKLSSRVCLTTNSWTSIQNLNYMCLAAHFIDDDWTLHRKIINFCPITSTSEVIGQSVERCLLDWGINKILTITVDNANYNNKGLAYLKRRLNSWEGTVLNGDFLHMRCAAHILSLTVREGLKELDDAVVRIRSAIKYVRSSPARAQKFKFCVEKERIESKSLPYLDVETRWNSTYLMLESAVKFQKAFELLETVDQNYVDELTPIIRVDRDLEEEDTKSMSDGRNSRIRGLPTEFDWEYVRNLLPFLKVFYDTTMRLSSSLYTTGNQYMIEIYAIGFLLTRLIEGKDVGASVMASKMKKKHDEYWANVDKFNMLLFIAVVLDPRYKLKYVLWVIEQTYSAANSELLKEKVKSILKNLFDSYKISLSPKVLVPQSEEVSMREVDTFVGGAVDYMNSMYFDMEDDSESTQNKTELDIYLLEIRVDRNDPTFNILEFWKSNSARYPVLSMMARDVLAIPASTVASELAFSTGGCVLDPFRSSLTPRMVEALICAQDWLRTAHGPLYLEEHLEDLEKIESEVSCLGEEQPVINLQDD